MTRGWWRRNALALGAIVVLGSATVVAVSLNAWRDLNSVQRMAVESGSSVSYGDAEIGPARAEFEVLDGIPRGTRVVAVELEIDPDGEAYPCSSPKLTEAGGAQRVWAESTGSLNRPYDADRVTYCDRALTEPYTLEVDYLVPEDAAGPFALEFVSSEAVPEVLLLELEP